MHVLVNMQDTELKANSPLFWMVALIAAGIIFIGARFLLAPLTAAAGFGVPVDGSRPLAYLYTKGVRDIVSGLLFAALLWSKASRRLLGTLLYVATIIPIGDMLIVYTNSGASAVLMIHGGTALFMLVVATLLRRQSSDGLTRAA